VLQQMSEASRGDRRRARIERRRIARGQTVGGMIDASQREARRRELGLNASRQAQADRESELEIWDDEEDGADEGAE